MDDKQKAQEWKKVDITARPQDDADAMAVDDVDCDRWTTDGAGIEIIKRADGTAPEQK